MWPFTSKKSVAVVPPTVISNGVMATYDRSWKKWTFSIGEDDFEVRGEIFDERVLEQVSVVPRWIADNAAQINSEIERHLKGWVEWDGEKQTSGGIDVTELTTKQQIDVE